MQDKNDGVFSGEEDLSSLIAIGVAIARDMSECGGEDLNSVVIRNVRVAFSDKPRDWLVAAAIVVRAVVEFLLTAEGVKSEG